MIPYHISAFNFQRFRFTKSPPADPLGLIASLDSMSLRSFDF